MKNIQCQSEIQIVEKPDWVSWEDIHNLLVEAHNENVSNGMIMRTVTQTGAELEERVGSGVCYIALEKGKLVGCAAIAVKDINTWFHKGQAAKLMLGAILPNYQGCGIYDMLQEKRYEYAKQYGVKVLMMDTAEHNTKMQHILKGKGFRYVSCFASPYSKHYSVVMAMWFDGCPFSKLYCWFKYHIKKIRLKIQVKPGGIKRF